MLKFVCLLAFVAACSCASIGGYEGYDFDEGYGDDTEGYLEELQRPLIRERRDLFGGRQAFPRGGYNERILFKQGPVWGGLSQNQSPMGKMSPITYSAGGRYNLPGGHSFSGGVDHYPKFGSNTNIRGTANIIDTDHNKLSAWVQHDRSLARNLKPIGKETNSAGVDYANSAGYTASLSAAKTPGHPTTGTIGGTIPIADLGNAKVEAYAKTDLAQGMKPQHEGGVQISASF